MSLSLVPEWALPFKIGELVVRVDDRDFTAHVLLRELEPSLPGFLGCLNGEFLFLSEDVPEEFRTLVLTHEIREFFLGDEPGKCKRVLCEEIANVPFEQMEAYLSYRTQFFRCLVGYYANQGGESVDGLKANIAESLAYLETLIGDAHALCAH